jgi:hypothetical protein
VKPQATAIEIKEELLNIITSIGGLKEGEASEEDDIHIPVPTYGDSDEEQVKVETSKDIPRLGDFVLGEPKDASDVYGGFKDIQEGGKGLSLKQFDILAFRLYDEKFEVIAPTVDE